MTKIKESFLKLTLRFAFVFFIFFTIIKVVIKIFSTGSFNQMVQAYFSEGNWLPFFTKIVVASILYGVFMAGYYKIFKK